MTSKFFTGFLILLVFAAAAAAQRQSAFIPPQTTDPAITTNLNNHYVSINRGVTRKNQLFLFFPGTGGVPANQLQITNTAADLGFHAINLTYPNDETVNGLCGPPSTDLDCYANVRLEIKDGIDRTTLVDVSRPNSIENRLIKLLIYLRTQAPNDNWGQFLINDSTINWSKIVVSGHSQGGGHAGIIGRYHSVVRVVMFAAMDFNGRANSPANWIGVPASTPNATPPERFWGFSHTRDDMVNFNVLSTRIWPAYGMSAFGSVGNVDTSTPPYGGTHSLTSNIECANFHGCVVVDASLVVQNGVPVFKPVWEYLLSNTTSPLTAASVSFERGGSAVPRPAAGEAAKRYRIIVDGAGFDTGSRILVGGVETETELVSGGRLRARLPAGTIRPPGRTTLQIRNSDGALSNQLTF